MSGRVVYAFVVRNQPCLGHVTDVHFGVGLYAAKFTGTQELLEYACGNRVPLDVWMDMDQALWPYPPSKIGCAPGTITSINVTQPPPQVVMGTDMAGFLVPESQRQAHITGEVRIIQPEDPLWAVP